MPNDFFQFKQFRIDQSGCPMKVTTDGCIFGASISMVGDEVRVLDIGTGTGLLALMVAQRTQAHVDAVEILAKAAGQAEVNFARSAWCERLHVAVQSIQQYVATCTRGYDLIVCNPPFFTGHRRSGTDKDLAIHDDTLPQAALISAADSLLSAQGSCWVMYPEFEFRQFHQKIAANGWYCQQELTVLNRRDSPVFRVIGSFGKASVPTDHRQLIIRDDAGAYTRDFSELLAPYYL